MRWLREWRVDRLMSIRDLAERAVVSTKTIVEIEHGRQVPRFTTMRRLADALGVDPGQVREFARALELRATSQRAVDADQEAGR